ncbi:sodium/calcium exchanger family protein, partial [Vibrio parahaemolyticus VPTS-2010]
PH